MTDRARLGVCLATAGVFGAFAAQAAATELAAINRWVGVGIALAGSIIVAPGGTVQLLLRPAYGTARTLWRWTARTARKFLPFLRKEQRQGAAVALAGGASMAVATGQASVRVWPGGGSVDERIDALRKYVAEVEALLSKTRNGLTQEAADRRAALAALETALREELRTLRQMLEAKDREAAVIDARGLPVIGLGVLLSGVPEELSRIPLGWGFPSFGVFVCLGAVIQAFQARDDTRRS